MLDRKQVDENTVILNSNKSLIKGCPSHEEHSEKEEYDFIKPKHYEVFPGMEDTFEIHRSYLTSEEYIGWLKGSILKYKLRMGEKPGESYERDMNKINIYREEMRSFINKNKHG